MHALTLPVLRACPLAAGINIPRLLVDPAGKVRACEGLRASVRFLLVTGAPRGGRRPQ
jgi:hypothetical protein